MDAGDARGGHHLGGVAATAPLDAVPPPLRGVVSLALRFGFTGSPERGEALLAPMRAVAAPVLDSVGPMSYADVDRIHMDPTEPMPAVARGGLLHSMPSALVDTLLGVAGPDVEVPLAAVEVRLMGGALSRPQLSRQVRYDAARRGRGARAGTPRRQRRVPRAHPGHAVLQPGEHRARAGARGGQPFDKVVASFGGLPDYRDLMEADSALPRWKAGHLAKNYSIYSQHREFIDPWAEKWGVWSPSFPPSRRKLEWQAQHTPRLWDMVMHLRPSGIRAKAPTYLPALVAITQTSVVGPRERRLSPRETARLQGLPDTFDFGDQRPAVTYRQMGNGVNVGVVWHIFREHALRDEEILKRTVAGRNIVEAVGSAPLSPDEILGRHRPVCNR